MTFEGWASAALQACTARPFPTRIVAGGSYGTTAAAVRNGLGRWGPRKQTRAQADHEASGLILAHSLRRTDGLRYEGERSLDGVCWRVVLRFDDPVLARCEDARYDHGVVRHRRE